MTFVSTQTICKKIVHTQTGIFRVKTAKDFYQPTQSISAGKQSFPKVGTRRVPPNLSHWILPFSKGQAHFHVGLDYILRRINQ